jgi:hypothetical protein
VSDDEEEPIIIRENLCNIKETVKASSKTLASIQPEFLSLQHHSSEELIVRVEDVTLLSIDRDSLQAAILLWKPNMETIAKHGATPSKLRYYPMQLDSYRIFGDTLACFLSPIH